MRTAAADAGIASGSVKIGMMETHLQRMSMGLPGSDEREIYNAEVARIKEAVDALRTKNKLLTENIGLIDSELQHNPTEMPYFFRGSVVEVTT